MTDDRPASLGAALLSLQADLPTVPKRQTAKVETAKGGYSYKYAGLGAVMSAILPRLSGLGVVFTTRPVLVDGRPVLLAELWHVASGERLTAEYPLPVNQAATAQATGSAISYGRRYCLAAMVGLVAEDDDDGRAASMGYDEPDRPRRGRRESTSDSGPKLISEPQLKKIMTLMTRGQIVDRDARLAFCAEVVGRQLGSSKELTLTEAARVIEALEAGLTDEHREDPGDPA